MSVGDVRATLSHQVGGGGREDGFDPSGWSRSTAHARARETGSRRRPSRTSRARRRRTVSVHDDFAGVIGRDRRDSTPAWPPRAEAPAGAPNVLYIVLDDVGFAQL